MTAWQKDPYVNPWPQSRRATELLLDCRAGPAPPSDHADGGRDLERFKTWSPPKARRRE